MIDEEDSNFLQDCLEAHGYVHSDCESDEGKSESDDELCRIKPPPIPYEEFQHKVIQIGKVYPVPSTSNAIPGSGTHLFLPNYLSQKDINLEMKKPYLVWQLPPQIILVPGKYLLLTQIQILKNFKAP